MNDVFDAELDKIERPERPIPSGLIKKSTAAIFGIMLLLAGIVSAVFVQPGDFLSISVILAVGIAVAALVYDKWLKHHPILGPLNMGLCRGLNLLLGMSIIADTPALFWYLGLVPVVYIAAITMISRGEVHGGHKRVITLAGVLYMLVLTAIAAVAYGQHTFLNAILFIAAFGVTIFIPLIKAMRNPSGPMIGRAVKMGILALILMNASWAATYHSSSLAILIVLLLPLSLLLARMFAVT